MELNRKHFLKLLAASGAVIGLSPKLIFSAEGNSELKKALNLIGNSNDEKERAEIIADALLLSSITDEEKEILEGLFFVADHWANGYEKYANPGSEGNESEGYLCSFFLFKCKIDRYLLAEVNENSPFYPLISFYRSRMLIAQMIQNGKISGNKKNREVYTNEGLKLMRSAVEAYPENELAKNYLGDYKPWQELVKSNPEAPEWANAQRMVLHKLTNLIHWWVDNRQISDGQFGGGWGDDVEMWRSWAPILFAFNDKKAIASQEKLFEGLFGLSRMSKGYTTYMNDVEHTSEEYADPLTCMLNVQPENPVWEERVLKVLDFIEESWSGINERGQLQFKSSYFNADKIDLDEKRACDTPYHTRLVQPLMLVWLRTGNERVGKFLKSWLKTWVDATFTEEKGKPLGITPAAIHWPDGSPSGTGKNWWQPENYPSNLYNYPSQQSSFYECFLQAYYITHNEYYLKPIRYVADKRLEGVGDGTPEKYEPGSFEWCMANIKGDITKVLMKYRIITGDNKYDSILTRDARGYERFVFDNDYGRLSDSLRNLQKSLSLPKIFYTTEVRWTDRLFASSKKYFNLILGESIPSFNAATLFSTLTGSIGNFKILPVYGVKWITDSTDIAVLVEINTTDKFEAKLFHFGNESRNMGARFFNLENGKYQFKLSGSESKEVIISADSRDVEFVIPEQKLVELVFEKK